MGAWNRITQIALFSKRLDHESSGVDCNVNIRTNTKKTERVINVVTASSGLNKCFCPCFSIPRTLDISRAARNFSSLDQALAFRVVFHRPGKDKLLLLGDEHDNHRLACHPYKYEHEHDTCWAASVRLPEPAIRSLCGREVDALIRGLLIGCRSPWRTSFVWNLYAQSDHAMRQRTESCFLFT